MLPVGSVEQHALLSLCVDAILSERASVEAAEPLKVPVYPCMAFGLAPNFSAFPDSMSLRVETLLAVFRDLIASAHRSGFRRVLIVNGHGGNAPVSALAKSLMAEMPNDAGFVVDELEPNSDITRIKYLLAILYASENTIPAG